MSRLTDQLEKMKQRGGVPADPLPETKTQGDSGETDVWDDNDTSPGIDKDGNHAE